MPTTYRADWVFSPQRPNPIRHGLISVHEGKILSVEPWDHETIDVDLGQSLVIPGLANYHVHLDLGGLHGKLPPPKSFTDWLRQVIAYRRNSDPVEWDRHIEAGIQESIRYGSTHLSDISVGGRSEPFLSKSDIGWDSRLELIGMSEERVELARHQATAWLEKNTKLSPQYFLSPHAPYTVSRSLLSSLLAINPDTPGIVRQVAMHVAESREEIELLENHRGPFKTLLEEMNAWHPDELLGSIDDVIEYLNQFDHALLIHGNYLTREQWKSIRDLTVVYCPRTHAYFGHEPHPYLEMLKDEVDVRLGTDSLASNPDLNLLEEGRFLWRRDREKTPLLGNYLLEMMTLFESAFLPGAPADFAVIPYDSTVSDAWEALWGSTALPSATYRQGRCINSSKE